MADQGPYSSYQYAPEYTFHNAYAQSTITIRELTQELAALRQQFEERDTYMKLIHSAVAEDYLCQLVAYIWHKNNTSGKPPEVWTKDIMQLMTHPSKRIEAKVMEFLKFVPSVENAIRVITTAPEGGWAEDYRPFVDQIIKYQAPIKDLCECEDVAVVEYTPPPPPQPVIPQPRSVVMTRGGRGRGIGN